MSILSDLQFRHCPLPEHSRREERLYARLQKAAQPEHSRLLLEYTDEKDTQRAICIENSYAAGLRDGIELMTELFAERLKEAEQ